MSTVPHTIEVGSFVLIFRPEPLMRATANTSCRGANGRTSTWGTDSRANGRTGGSTQGTTDQGPFTGFHRSIARRLLGQLTTFHLIAFDISRIGIVIRVNGGRPSSPAGATG